MLGPVLQYIPRNMHTVFALLCFVVVIHWLISPYPSDLLHWHCGNLTIAPVPAKQPWWIWINTSCEFIMNDCITTTKQSTTKPCAYFLGYTVWGLVCQQHVSRTWTSNYIPQYHDTCFWHTSPQICLHAIHCNIFHTWGFSVIIYNIWCTSYMCRLVIFTNISPLAYICKEIYYASTISLRYKTFQWVGLQYDI